jgi:hypothetical protein
MPIITTTKKTRPRAKNDYYPTKPAVAEAGLRDMLPAGWEPKVALDPGAGDGIFGNAIRVVFPSCVVDGCDIRDIPKPESYRHWWAKRDFTIPFEADKIMRYDLIVGNPPYGKLGELFVRRSFRLLNPGGKILFLFRMSFAGSQERILGLYTEHPLTALGLIAPRPSFLPGNEKGTDSDEYAYFLFDNPPSPYRTYLTSVYWGKKDRIRDTRQLSFL